MAIGSNLIIRALRECDVLNNLSAAEWGDFFRLTRNSDTYLRFGYLLSNCKHYPEFPEKVRDYLAGAKYIAAEQQRSVRWEARCIAKLLAEIDVVPIFLKGAAYILAELPPAQGRGVRDVDILVPQENLRDVEALLLKSGWGHVELNPYDQRYFRDWMHELPPLQHRKRRTVLDVHHTILPKTGRIHPDVPALLAGARTLQNGLGKVLCPQDMLLHSAAHLFLDGEFDGALRDLTDMDLLLRHFSAQEAGFWNSLVDRARLHQLERPLYYALRYTTSLLGTPVPLAVLSAAEIGRPKRLAGLLMDACFIRAVLPEPKTENSLLTTAARLSLYIRSHWLKMPPLLLFQHLYQKALRRWFTAEEELDKKRKSLN